MRRILSAAFVLTLLAVGSVGSGAAASPPSRALWLWHGPDPEVLEFARVKGIETLFLHVPIGFSESPQVEAFVDRGRAAGLRVWALGGRPSWSWEAAELGRWVEEVVSSGVFDGVIVDVEPHAADAWRHERARPLLISEYLRGLEIAERLAEPLPFVAAVPFWYDGEDYRHRGRLLVEAVLDRVDGIVVMGYRDRALGGDGIVALIEDEVRHAARRGKTAMLVVQTARDELDKLTFYEEGEASMEGELALVTSRLGRSPAFAGISIHHYPPYRILRP